MQKSKYFKRGLYISEKRNDLSRPITVGIYYIVLNDVVNEKCPNISRGFHISQRGKNNLSRSISDTIGYW